MKAYFYYDAKAQEERFGGLECHTSALDIMDETGATPIYEAEISKSQTWKLNNLIVAGIPHDVRRVGHNRVRIYTY